MFSRMVVVGDGSVGSLTVQLGDNPNGIYIKDISGLDPVKATLTSSNFAGQTGAIFQSSRRESRNITIKMGVDPDPTTQTVRSVKRSIYNVFRPETEILLKFYDDDSDVPVTDGYQIRGRVEYCQSPMFAQDPEVDVSIMCFDPDFQDASPITVNLSTDPSLAATYFPYDGSTETGVTITLNVNAAISAFNVYYIDGSNVTWNMDATVLLQVGDVVTINTTPGNKSATLVRAGVTTSILYAISPQSTWPKLAPGDNWFRIHTSAGIMPATISYTKRFGEV
jgi:hypothetical protein